MEFIEFSLDGSVWSLVRLKVVVIISYFGKFWAVSIECVNICKFWKGDVAGRFECSMLSCASKAPRALTGFLASTAHPPQACGRTLRRNSVRCVSNY